VILTLAPAAILSAPPILFTRLEQNVAGIASLYMDEKVFHAKKRTKINLSSDR
jgi:hypothetical protein